MGVDERLAIARAVDWIITQKAVGVRMQSQRKEQEKWRDL